MRNKILLLTFLVVLSAHVAFAEVITLKNGRTMTGRIVEKNPQYLVLKTGEGEAAVKTTIFLEDISRIEGEESSFSVFGDPRQAIKNLVYQDLRLKARGNGSDIGFDIPEIPPESTNTTDDVVEQPAAAEEPGAGTGEISGTISLPYSPSATPPEPGASGALYVYLMKEDDKGGQVLTTPSYFDRIDAGSIASLLVPYDIKHIPLGQYHVVAAWDVASPPITNQVIDDKRILNLTLEKGDYRGAYENTVEISRAAEKIGGININCTTFNETNRISKKPPRPAYVFEITDVYYAKPPQQRGQIVMTIKNTGKEPIEGLVLGIAIDDRWSQFPVEIGTLPLGAEKSFDITSFYVDDLMSRSPEEAPSAEQKVRAVRIKFRRIPELDVIFEKSIQIF